MNDSGADPGDIGIYNTEFWEFQVKKQLLKPKNPLQLMKMTNYPPTVEQRSAVYRHAVLTCLSWGPYEDKPSRAAASGRRSSQHRSQWRGFLAGEEEM